MSDGDAAPVGRKEISDFSLKATIDPHQGI
jgi:hypothetical protein